MVMDICEMPARVALTSVARMSEIDVVAVAGGQ